MGHVELSVQIANGSDHIANGSLEVANGPVHRANGESIQIANGSAQIGNVSNPFINMYLKTYIVPPPGKFVSLVQPVSRWVCHLWVGTKQIYYPHPWRGALRVEAMVPSWRLGSFCGVFVYCIYDFVGFEIVIIYFHIINHNCFL